MKDDMDYIEWIKAYVDDELTPKEHRDFEEEVFPESSKLKELLNEVLSQAENKELRDRLLQKLDLVSNRRAYFSSVLNNYNSEASDEMPLDEQVVFDYLSGYLPSTETSVIQRIIKKYPDVAAFVEEQSLLLDEIKGMETDDTVRSSVAAVASKMESDHFFETLEKEEPNQPVAKEVSLFSKYRWGLIAASITVLIVAGVFLLRPSNTDFNQIYIAHHQVEKELTAQLLDKVGTSGLAGQVNPQKELTKPLGLYQTGDFQSAKELLTDYLKTKPNDEDAQFALGLTLMELKEFEPATVVFKTLSESSDDWKDEATFQLAMSYLRIPSKASLSQGLLLEVSQNTNAYYQSEAQKILENF